MNKPVLKSAGEPGSRHFAHVIVGTGQAVGTLLSGLPTDESVAIIEGGAFGGTCVNTGCTPTKTLVASARVAHLTRNAAEYGVNVGSTTVDFARVRARMNAIRHASRDDLRRWLLAKQNVTLYRDWARFKGPKDLRVGAERITGDRIYLNVGARSVPPAIPGLAGVPWLDHAGLLELEVVPEHLLIIGGGYIGLEFAQIFARFGSKITVIDSRFQIMSREDSDVASEIQGILEEEGITFRLGAQVERVEKSGEGARLVIKLGDERESVTGTHLLIAAGRKPNSDHLDTAAAGIHTDARGFIRVDDHLQTSVAGVYALGDVNGQGAFTHTSVNDAEIVLDHLSDGPRRLSDRITTYAMFVDPPLARVGLTEREALANGYQVLKASKRMEEINRAKEMGETKGFVKLLVDGETDMFLGASIVGVNGDEIINMLVAFMYSGLPWQSFRQAVLVHPTVSELIPWMLDELESVSEEGHKNRRAGTRAVDEVA